ncbi:MAG: hypothetical protein F6K10_26445 [Moorea sp. SIO2B7]|nr:hypothetical protein [Moorena sp. SIO2B7]
MLNNQGIDWDISTFSKGSKKRDTQVFKEIITKLQTRLKKEKEKKDAVALFPRDSTIISLTSKWL